MILSCIFASLLAQDPLNAPHNIREFLRQLGGPSSLINSPYVTGALAVGFFGGVASFWKGLGVYRQFRVVEDIPRVSVRSVAMGEVQVSGRAGGTATLVSPVTRTPCLFYRAVVERRLSGSESDPRRPPRWVREKVVDQGGPFYLDDGTGRVAVDLRGADIRIQSSGDCEMDPASAYAAAYSGDSLSPDDIHPESSLGDACRLTEYLVEPGKEYDVVGSYAPNPDPQDGAPRNLIQKGSGLFLVSDGAGRTLQTDLKHQAAAKVFGGAILAVLCLAVMLGQFGLL